VRKLDFIHFYTYHFFQKNSKELILKQTHSVDEIFKEYEKFIHVNFLCKTENLKKDIIKALKKADVRIDTPIKNKLLNKQKENITKHKPYREYYNEETKEIVRNLDRHIIRKHGYEF